MGNDLNSEKVAVIMGLISKLVEKYNITSVEMAAIGGALIATAGTSNTINLLAKNTRKAPGKKGGK